ncbi:hypothetical protein F5X68DRAFT_217147 [Plectosphaerella plurivora]|uniref:GRIP domain-containing protein n=1 Tax=Plectosphaerella plurivora TaxID=936078 RepID=A0A9P8V1X8_9PEZI|nr:hypothetical protein F5X68DRAFT_217147 [Plectosphaerella plurivora]
MSTTAPPTDPVQGSSTGKKKNNKKKKNANKPKEPVNTGNGAAPRDNDEADDEPETPVQETSTHTDAPAEPEDTNSKPNGTADDPNGNGHAIAADDSTPRTADEPQNGNKAIVAEPPSSETAAKIECLTQERDELKSEVEQLRTQLEALKSSSSGNDDVAQLRTELEEANTAKEQAEEAYQGLLERVNHLKTTLGDRLKRDRAELEEAKERIEELETQNEQLQDGSKDFETQISKLKEELQDAAREATSLRSRGNLSQQNWVKERDELARLVSSLKEEVETTTNAMGEWEVIAMEERSVKESLVEKVAELEEQAASLRDNYQNAAAERDGQLKTIDNLQTALSDIQEARRRELREMVETSEEQLQALKKLVHEAGLRAQKAEAARENLDKELERTAPFEKEVKEKNLLIGKLRHEAIVLNDHLTKALRYLKKTKPEDNVDRQIVTNHMLHFLTLDRSDPKRFQILQVMAGYLNWTDEQREQAGLARPGGGGSSLRLPASPFHRTPSTPSLNADFFADGGGSGSGAHKESLGELWTAFLERQAQEGLTPDEGPSRKGSNASSAPRPEMRGA